MTSLVNLSRTTALTINGTLTAVSFDTADEHNATFWSGSNQTRITIPSGVTEIELFGYMVIPAGGVGATDIAMVFRKNGSSFAEFIGDDQTYGAVIFHTGMMSVTTGDYFELAVQRFGSDQTVASGNLIFGAATPERKGFVTAYLNSDTTPVSGSDTALSWALPEVDTHNTHDGTTGFTVPAGTNYAIVNWNGGSTSFYTSPNNYFKVKKNGTVVREWRDVQNWWAPGPPAFGIIPVAPGDVLTFAMRAIGLTMTTTNTKVDIEWIA